MALKGACQLLKVYPNGSLISLWTRSSTSSIGLLRSSWALNTKESKTYLQQHRYINQQRAIFPLLSSFDNSKNFYSTAPKTRARDTEDEDLKNELEQDKILPPPPPPPQPPKSKGLIQRFKDSYIKYGKVLIAVHGATSIVWFGAFYYAAASGIDVAPILQNLGFSETVIKPFKASGVGNFAVAYLIYKLATPARYGVTIVGTRQTARLLRKYGHLQPVPKGEKIGDLLKESSGNVRKNIGERTEKVKKAYHDGKKTKKKV